jgi:chromosome segregation ATPase
MGLSTQIVLLTTKHQRDDVEKKLMTKEQALERARREVDTLKKVIHQNTSMVSMQRDHAVGAMTEKDRLLQNYKEKIDRLTDELDECKRREQQKADSFERELQILQESLASVETPQSTTSDRDYEVNHDNIYDDEVVFDSDENKTPRVLKVLTNQQQVNSDNDEPMFAFKANTSGDDSNSNNNTTTTNEGGATVKGKSLLSSSLMSTSFG